MHTHRKNTFRFYRQLEQKDCGAACMRMLCAYYGKAFSLRHISELCFANRMGTSMAGLLKGAETLGFKAIADLFTVDEILNEAPLPAFLFWKKKHYVLLLGAAKGSKKNTHVVIADPERGKLTIHKNELLKNWISDESNMGYALIAEPGENFYTANETIEEKKSSSLPVWAQLKTFKKYFLQIALGMLVAACINLFFPVITKALVDKGVQQKDISVITMLLMAQLALFAGNLLVEIIRGWTVLYINARINIQIISSFLIKLIKLPIGFFDTRLMTDIMLRIDDHERIEQFLSSSSMNVLFSFLTVTVLSVVFCMYSPLLFFIFLIGSIVSVLWIIYFLRRRKAIDYNRFELQGESRNQLYEIIDGMCEIKLNNAERAKRFEWERQQVKIFGVNKKALRTEQWQHTGFSAVTQLKNLLITFVAAYLVVNDSISLGTMLSITLLAGQLNQPLESFVQFFQSLQNAHISIDRLNDIYARKDEDEIHNSNIAKPSHRHEALMPGCISIHNISFSYNGALGPDVLKDLSFCIPKNKVTAIVGSSGSGKTTLFKLLLKFYEPQHGFMAIGEDALPHIHPDAWRAQCGVVMQDGYIFSDTILRNIAVSDETPDIQRVQQACSIANIHEYISELPLGYHTHIGGSGIGISGGQKQRILIARAVYKNPDYLFFDEATSALDAENEKIIMQNLQQFYKGKTVLIIAHRLSTVKNADKIIVLHKGKIAEQGTHAMLTQQKGFYYSLVKNQLELGN